MIYFNLLTEVDYISLRYNVVSNVEGVEFGGYPDSKGIPSIGIGMNLRDGNVRKAK